MEKVKFEGREYTLQQDAYIDGVAGDTPVYKAMALDDEGNEYEVTWEVVDHWEELEDESEMCDWENPVSVESI